ncbi:hypothetical protein C4565_00535 [Candidatus Parcubacteria bacterium]|nr:MAG: hypothetical protein C4565_00535 [Candidatus Parcubacteria bacterium]
MLEVQKYLKSGKTLEDLKNELGINTAVHPELPLVIFNYDQIDSPKTHPIVRECRALTLDKDWDLVSRSFNRFYNWGEVAHEMKLFNFSKSWASDKEDGSLVKLYNYKGKWHASTRGSFGLDHVNGSPYTWQELFLKGLQLSSLDDLKLDPNLTYVTEFVSPYNKVVRKYVEPKFYLLTTFCGEQEMPVDVTDSVVDHGMLRPTQYKFINIDEVISHIGLIAENDPSYEGIVICDDSYNRWKIKSPKYLALHAMWGNGNLFLPKYLLPFILSGDTDELLAYYPEVKDVLYQYKNQVDAALVELIKIWQQCWEIESQKEFALAIVGKTSFSGLLFTLRRKYGKEQTLDLLKEAWKNNADGIEKVLS